MNLPWFCITDDLSKGDTRFVTVSAARRATMASACAAAVLSLAAGLGIGRFTSTPSVSSRKGPTERHYVVGEIGRLDAAMALLEPRMERLSTQLASLRQFDQRLRASCGARPEAAPSYAGSGDERGATGGKGGPLVAPMRCVGAARVNLKNVNGELVCMAAALNALELATAQHETAWEAFPGRRPVQSARYGSPFGNRIDPFTHHLSFHPGADLVAPAGMPILATAGGLVVLAGQKPGYGNAIEIDHGNGYVTRYGHASKIAVHVGQVVLPQQRIGDVGSTGRSTGPHLHFEVIMNGQPVDPADYLAIFTTSNDG